MIAMSAQLFINGRVFNEDNKKQQSLNALEENLILERCIIFSILGFPSDRGKLES
jgi:hypothetical protein